MKLETIRESTGHEASCVYLPEERSRTSYRVIDHCSVATYSQMLERGWRRFGRVFFRPACAACHECRSLRIDVERFRPNRSMRRNLKKNRDLEVRLRPATMTGEHLELYDRYHLDMTERKGWSEKSIDPFEYFHTFVDGRQDFGHELHYLHEGQLLGVALVDVLPSALSAVYCYYEPAQRSRGLGVYSVLQQILLAKALGAQHVYLGYWIENHRDMRYKARYRPHEILDERPAFDERPPWVVVDDSSRAVPKPG